MTRAPVALLLLLAMPLGAAEVCRFRALDPENPFRRWLTSQEVLCVAAGDSVTFPTGLWNVFARAEGAISAAPLLVDGDAEPATVAPALGPAAAVTPLLPQGHTGVVYAPRRGSAFPVEAPRTTVPADEPLWLLVLAQSDPVAVIPIAPLPPGTERPVDARSGGPPSLLGWLRLSETDRTAVADATGVSAPALRAGTRDADPLPPPALLHGAFFRVRDVLPGNAELRAEGRGWLPERRVVKVQPGVTVAAAPLTLRAAGTLTVHWNSGQDLRELDRSVGACRDDEAAPQITITVSKCTQRPGVRPDSDCAPFREEKADALQGSLTFDDVVPGTYRAEMRFGKLPPALGGATVGPLRVADLRVFASWYTVYGSLTRGGEPLGEDVSLRFAGVGFARAESEEYHAVVNKYVDEESQIEVAACDGAPRAVILTDRPMRPRARFDLDIPANELAIHVIDTFTRDALPGASVKLEAMSVLKPSRVVFTTASAADEQGSVLWSGVPVREIHLTVSHPGYEKRKLEAFTMPKSGTRTVDAQLVPLRGTRGKIVSERPFDSASVVWYSPAGSETERAELAEDGTFVYQNWHTPEETMAVVSASHPLWVLRAPASERRQSLALRFPDAPAAAFDVWRTGGAAPGETRYVGLAIGGVRVPQPVLAQHQTLRRDPTLMRGRGPHHFRDLLATGPIDVLLGPLQEEVASRARAMDLFALPQYADPPRQRLEPGTTDVVFQEP